MTEIILLFLTLRMISIGPCWLSWLIIGYGKVRMSRIDQVMILHTKYRILYSRSMVSYLLILNLNNQGLHMLFSLNDILHFI